MRTHLGLISQLSSALICPDLISSTVHHARLMYFEKKIENPKKLVWWGQLVIYPFMGLATIFSFC
jgi:hypothetical protein